MLPHKDPPIVKCKVKGCIIYHARDKLMCRKHWGRVSRETRDIIWVSLKDMNKKEYDEAEKRAFTEVEKTIV